MQYTEYGRVLPLPIFIVNFGITSSALCGRLACAVPKSRLLGNYSGDSSDI
jgi:hypothetical protein